MDLVGPLPESQDGAKWIIVLVDYFTKWPVVGALNRCDAKEVIQWMRDQVLTVYGVPEEVVTDQGVQFMSGEFANS
jgi:Integrase core domain.